MQKFFYPSGPGVNLLALDKWCYFCNPRAEARSE